MKPSRAVQLAAVVLGAAAGLIASYTTRPPFASERSGVEAAYAAWRDATLQKDGPRGADLLTPESTAYFGRLRHHSLYSGEAELSALPVIDEMMVLMLRILVPTDELAAMDDRQTAAYAISTKFVAQAMHESSDVGSLAVRWSGGVAEGFEVRRGKTTDVPIRLERNGGVWQVDVRPEVANMDVQIRNVAAMEDKDPRVMGMRIVEFFTRRLLTPELLDPPRAAAQPSSAAAEPSRGGSS